MNNSAINLSKSLAQCLLLIIFFLAVTPLQAQEQVLTDYNKNLKVGLGTRGNINLNFEHAINSFSSVQVNYRWHSYDERDDKSTRYWPIFPLILIDIFGNRNRLIENKVSGSSLSLEYRLYVSKRELGKKLKGIYFAPQVSIGRHSQSYKGRPGFGYFWSSRSSKIISGATKQTNWSLGMKIGYQKRWNKFTFDCGVDIRKNAVIGKADSFQLSNGETIPFAEGIDGRSTSAYFGIGMSF